jgi:hypothetical protein
LVQKESKLINGFKIKKMVNPGEDRESLMRKGIMRFLGVCSVTVFDLGGGHL